MQRALSFLVLLLSACVLPKESCEELSVCSDEVAYPTSAKPLPALDQDQDGILEQKDACPTLPEDKDSFQDEDGCPDPDNDQDAILDIDDMCPNDPEDKDLFEDEDGCPELDNDKDGILDMNDYCPYDPENLNNYQDEDGCPDPVCRLPVD